MAVASKIVDDQLLVIDDLSFETPKTKDMVSVLRHLDCNDGSLLVAIAGNDANVYKSVRNIPGVSVAPAAELNALSVLSSRRLLATTAALDLLKQKAANEGAGKNGSTKKGEE